MCRGSGFVQADSRAGQAAPGYSCARTGGHKVFVASALLLQRPGRRAHVEVRPDCWSARAPRAVVQRNKLFLFHSTIIIIGTVPSIIADLAMGQIPRSTERIDGFHVKYFRPNDKTTH